MIYNLLITNVEPSIILKDLLLNLCNKNLSEKIKHKIINSASSYDHSMVKHRREIIHLEAFIINVMNIITK